jgi:hypothetical protein
VNQIARINTTMSSLEVAELTGKLHKNVVADIRKMLEELGIAAADFSATAKVAGPNGSMRAIEIFKLPKRESLILVSGYSTEMRARIIDRWQDLEAVGAAAVPSLSTSKLVGELAVLECFTRLLRPSPSSQVAMLAHISKNHGLDRSYLPSYVEDTAPDMFGSGSMPTKALSALLGDHNIDYTAKEYNTFLREAGFVEVRSRKSSSPDAIDGMKKFYVITEKGMRFGKNLTNPKSPRATQPHWYESRFSDLNALVMAHVRTRVV